MNNLDSYESWAEDFRETELDFMLLGIHKPKLQTYDFRGPKLSQKRENMVQEKK